MKNFRVLIIMLVGVGEEVHYHEFQTEAKDEDSIFKKIKRKRWFRYTRETKSITKGITKVTTYHEFIQVKNISDICINEIKEEKR